MTLADGAIVEHGRSRIPLGRILLGLAAAYFLALRLAFLFGGFPIADEAYYWMWGQHPALSYFDHPPLNAWLLAASAAVFGTNPFALRLPTLLALLAILWVFMRIAQRMNGRDWFDPFLKSTVVFLASPLFGFFTGSVFPDYLLASLLLLAGYHFFVCFSEIEASERTDVARLVLAGALLGLAGLAKYNAIFVGLAVAATIIARPKLRRLLLSWPVYLAGAVAIVLQAPILIWNMQHDFASLQFHLSDRFGSAFTGLNLEGMKGFLLETSLLFSPLLLPPLVLFFIRPPTAPLAAPARTLAFFAFLFSTATFLYIANYSWVLWWWNIAAFVLALPFLGARMGWILMTLHVLWGGFINSVMMLSLVVVPVTMLFGAGPIGEAETAFGWDRIVERMETASTEHSGARLAANSYQRASQLAFATGDTSIAALSSRRDAFDDWTANQIAPGADAVVLVDPAFDTETWKTEFTSYRLLETVTAERFGLPLKTYEIYLGENHR